jgi:excinuclease UvrABC ATPase subunit
MITVTGARTHNLRDIDVSIPAHALTVVTGVSGSGKSSLVFDTVAAEAQRATAAGYPSFVRTRLARYPAADVDRIDGLTFTTVVDQHRFTGNARSTVATAVDLSTPLRMLFSRFAVPSAGFSPAYSPNDPAGMCPTCEGLGTVSVVDEDALIDPALSLEDGAVQFPTFAPGTYRWKRLVTAGLCDPSTPWSQLSPQVRDVLLHARDLRLDAPLPGYPAHGRFDGIVPRLQDSYLRRTPSRLSAAERAGLAAVVDHRTCPDCGGARINAAARNSLINGRSIAGWSTVPVTDLRGLVDEAASLGESAAPLLADISRRVDALVEVGLGYLDLDRPSPTLSGGEAQRVKMVRHCSRTSPAGWTPSSRSVSATWTSTGRRRRCPAVRRSG